MESFPEDVEGRKVSGSFLHNATLALFEQQGFERDPQDRQEPVGRATRRARATAGHEALGSE